MLFTAIRKCKSTLSNPNHYTAFIEEAAFQVYNFHRMGDFLRMSKQLSVSPMYILLLFKEHVICLKKKIGKKRISTIYRLISNTNNDQLPVGLIAQLVEHYTNITEVRVRVPFRLEFFRPFFRDCLKCPYR